MANGYRHDMQLGKVIVLPVYSLGWLRTLRGAWQCCGLQPGPPPRSGTCLRSRHARGSIPPTEYPRSKYII